MESDLAGIVASIAVCAGLYIAWKAGTFNSRENERLRAENARLKRELDIEREVGERFREAHTPRSVAELAAQYQARAIAPSRRTSNVHRVTGRHAHEV